MNDIITVEDARVAWVTPILGRGDKLIYMGPLLKGLTAQCREFHVFTAEFGGNPDDVGFGLTLGGTIRRVNRQVTTSGIPLALPLIGPTILKSIYRYRADLIIVTEFGLLTLYSMLLTALLRRTKVLLIVENLPTILNRGLNSHIRRWVRRWIANRADTILTNNVSGKNYLVEHLGVTESKIISQPYLVSDMASRLSNQEHDKTGQIRSKEEKVRFLYVGRLIASKGLNFALEACANLLASCSGKFHFDIVGDGELRHDLERQCEERGLSNHVTFHGQQPYESLEMYYRNADVFLFPTLQDYRALVSFEAISAGLAVLISIYDGSRAETVAENRNGFSFDPRDVTCLTELMQRIINDPGMIDAFSRQSLEMARPYTLDNAVGALVTACRQALGEPVPEPPCAS